MANKIVRKLYESIRSQFYKFARNWNGVNAVQKLNGQSPSWSPMGSGYSEQGRWVPGRKGQKIQKGENMPEQLRNLKEVDYSGQSDEVYQGITEESSRIHTLGNENNIRNSVIALNNVTYSSIGQYEGISKQNIAEKGNQINVDLSTVHQSSNNPDVQSLLGNGGIKKYSQLSNNPNDNNFLNYPYQTSAINVSDNGIKATDVLTYCNGKNYKLDESEIVRYQDYEEIENVLKKIDMCLSKRNIWFDNGGRCQLSCQVKCQHTCQLSCQGCDRKQCHNQHCGSV